MPINQISKIQHRRGPEIDLPGAPIAFSPVAFEPGLDIGELGFATDTGRLFIGHDPSQGQPNHERITFPYKNIEVITENATHTFRRMTNDVIKDTDKGAFHSALLGSQPNYQDITIDGEPVRFPGGNLLIMIDYFVFTTSNMPVRQGTLRIAHVGGGALPEIADNAVSARRGDIIKPPIPEDNVDQYQNVEFKVEPRSDGTGTHFRFQYRNHLGVPLKIMFKTTRPMP